MEDLRISWGRFTHLGQLLDVFVGIPELLGEVVESRHVDVFDLGDGLLLVDQFLLLVGVTGLHTRNYRGYI